MLLPLTRPAELRHNKIASDEQANHHFLLIEIQPEPSIRHGSECFRTALDLLHASPELSTQAFWASGRLVQELEQDSRCLANAGKEGGTCCTDDGWRVGK